MRFNFFQVIAIALLGIVVSPRQAASDPLPYFVDKDLTPKWVAAKEVPNIHRIPNFNLTDQKGRGVGPANFPDSILVVNFFFSSCPGICRKLTGNMQKLQTATAGDPRVHLLSISVQPEVDTPEKLEHFAQEFNADLDRWHFLTGDKGYIYDLARRYFFADAGPKFQENEEDFLHTENFYLLDRDRHIRGVYSGSKAVDIELLIADIKDLEQR